MKKRPPTSEGRRAFDWISSLGVGCGFNPDGGSGRDCGVAVLFDALHQRLGVVAKAQRRLEGVAFLKVAEGEVLLDLLGDLVHAVFDCDGFHYFFCFLLLVVVRPRP